MVRIKGHYFCEISRDSGKSPALPWKAETVHRRRGEGSRSHDVETFARLNWMASRTSLDPPAFHSFLKRQMSPPPSDLSEGVNTPGPGRQGKYSLVFHIREVPASWSHLQRCRCLQHLHLLNSDPHLGTTYPEAPKPGPPKQFPWLSLVHSCQCRRWPASQALHRE